jgi:hypothetical protein
LMIDNESEFRQMSQQAQQQQYGNRQYRMEQSRHSNSISQQWFVDRQNENGRQQRFDEQVYDRQQISSYSSVLHPPGFVPWMANANQGPVMPPPGFGPPMNHSQSSGFSQFSQNENDEMQRRFPSMEDAKVKPDHEVTGYRLFSIPDISADETPEEIAEFFMSFDSITTELDDKQRVSWLDRKLKFGSLARLVFEDANEFFVGSYEKIRMAIWEQLGVFEKYDIVYDKAWFKQRDGKADTTPGLRTEPNCVSIGFMCMPNLDDERKAVDEHEIPFQVKPKIEDHQLGCPTGNFIPEPKERVQEFDEIAFEILFAENSVDEPTEERSCGSCIAPQTEAPIDKASAMIEHPPMECKLLVPRSSRGCDSPPRHLVNFRSPCRDHSRLNLEAVDGNGMEDHCGRRQSSCSFESVLLTADHTKPFGRQLGACWRDSSKLGA